MTTVAVRWATLAVPEHLLAWLTSPERDRWSRLRRAEDRNRFLGAHALGRIVVAEALRCPPEAVELRQRCATCEGPHGRPEAIAAGRPAPAVSLAHAGSLVVAAVSTSPVGVDVEPIAHAAEALDAIEWAAITPGERDDVDRLAPHERHDVLLRRWVAREAVAKARGIGLADHDRIDERGYRVVPLDLDRCHVAAVAVRTRRSVTVEVSELRWATLRAAGGALAPTATSRTGRRVGARRPAPPAP